MFTIPRKMGGFIVVAPTFLGEQKDKNRFRSETWTPGEKQKRLSQGLTTLCAYALMWSSPSRAQEDRKVIFLCFSRMLQKSILSFFGTADLTMKHQLPAAIFQHFSRRLKAQKRLLKKKRKQRRRQLRRQARIRPPLGGSAQRWVEPSEVWKLQIFGIHSMNEV